MMKRMMALLLAVVLCLTLFTGCGEKPDTAETTPTPEPTTPPAVINYDAAFAKYAPETVVMTVDGKDVTWSEFFYMLYSSLSQIEYYMGEIRWNEELVEGMTFDGYTMDMTMTMLKQMHAVENKSKELKLKITAEDQKLIEANKESVMAQYCGENATEEDFNSFLLSKLYLTPDIYSYINENSLKYEKLFTESIGAAGEKITDEEVAAFIETVPYVSAKHILLMTVNDETGEALDAETVAKAKQTADELLVRLQAEADPTKRAKLFDELMFEYNEDPGLAVFPEGYTFTYNEMYPVFEEAVFALENYEISGIVESQAGYHIIMRVPTHKDSVVNFDYETNTFYTVLAYAATDIYAQRLRGWMDELNVQWAEGFENLTCEQIFA
jgi:parvulin-like peptidyl-prolyl isomerase